MERLRKGLSIFAAAALLAPAGGALAGRPVFHHHRSDHDGEEADHPSDRGAKPAKTTAGELTLRSRVLLAKDGKSQLEVSTAAFDIGATPPGNISEVHVRAVDPSRRDDDDDKDDKDGKEGKELRFRREYNHLRGGGYFTPTELYTVLPHGQTLRIEAKARGVTRRDEVEAKWLDVVRYRPDVVVTQVDAPAQVPVNAKTNITAKLVEAMGELGAHTDCVLLVDDQPVDSALDVPLDANGSNTCIFTTTFTVQGHHTLKVQATNVRPGDYDYSNNTSPAVGIDVLNPVIPVYDAQVTETTTVNVNTTDTYNTSASTTPDTHVSKTVTSVLQDRSFNGTIPSAVNVSNPLKFSYSEMSAGQVLSSITYDNITFDSKGNFVDDDALNSGRVLGIMRSDVSNTTNIMFKWITTDTVTFSQTTCKALGLGCVPGDFTVGPATPKNIALGNDYAATAVLDDGTPYTANPALTLSPFGSTTFVRVRNICGRLTGTTGKRCFITDTAMYGKTGAVAVGQQTASTQ